VKASQTLWILLGAGAILLVGLFFAFSGGAPTVVPQRVAGGEPAKPATPSVAPSVAPTPPTPAEDRNAILALCDRYLIACAADDLRAGYEMQSSRQRKTVSFTQFSESAKTVDELAYDENLRSEMTPFVRRMANNEGRPATVNAYTAVFVEQSTDSAHMTYQGLYGVESFFELDVSFVKEAGVWKMEWPQMIVASGA
jgi:hypothetical protein